VLGNHDLRIRDESRLRGALSGAGLVDLGGRSQTVGTGERNSFGGQRTSLVLARGPHRRGAAGRRRRPLRILLAHSPDQFAWARARNFDLVLAGHTHGGQIRLPLVGAVACPSRLGVKYACGVFQEGPSILHVSRGVSSLLPLRINCLPELTRLVLTRANRPET